eukprot:SAG11_NODE_917_length_6553_cov_24.570654_8_plen_61_part_00
MVIGDYDFGLVELFASSSRSPKSDLASCRSVSLVEQSYFRLSPQNKFWPLTYFLLSYTSW